LFGVRFDYHERLRRVQQHSGGAEGGWGCVAPGRERRMATTTPSVKPEAPRTRVAPLWHVVLLDDDDHTYDYVIEMLRQLFGHTEGVALRMAREVDSTGRVIVDTTTRERAELKRDQIHAFGPDPLIPRCQGSMSASIEPAA
jgi:ATP-dependent Clp protease adaptor protein ClpS